MKAATFETGHGFALGHNPGAPSPFVTWQFTEGENGHRDYYWGRYGTSQAVSYTHLEPEPEKKDSPLLSLLLIGAVVLAGGGIGYYFKIYKPKHEAPDLEDDYCEYEDGELEEIEEEPEEEDTPQWEEDTDVYKRQGGNHATQTDGL